jgi:Xaa-Pro aminopeptidase
MPKSGRPFLLVPQMEAERAKKAGKKAKAFKDFYKNLRKEIGKAKIIGIDRSRLKLIHYLKLKKELKNKKFVDISKELAKLRTTKTKQEINSIKKACKISDSIVEKCLKTFKKFKSELDAANFLEIEAKKQGLDCAFKPIVASGSNSCLPHHKPANTKLKKGFCIIDFGVKYNGYCSDMTRTVYIGKPSKEQLTLYDLILSIQESLIKNLKLGKKFSELDKYFLDSIGKYKKNTLHAIGHGIGLAIHESPNINSKSKDKLEENMVFALEPAVYFKNKFGIRIEDTILIGKKPVVLTKTSKKLKIINL